MGVDGDPRMENTNNTFPMASFSCVCANVSELYYINRQGLEQTLSYNLPPAAQVQRMHSSRTKSIFLSFHHNLTLNVLGLNVLGPGLTYMRHNS
jgi:hypothetical protein